MRKFITILAFMVFLAEQALGREIHYLATYMAPNHPQPLVRKSFGPYIKWADAVLVRNRIKGWSQNRFEAYERFDFLIIQNTVPCKDYAATEAELTEMRRVIHSHVPTSYFKHSYKEASPPSAEGATGANDRHG